MRKGSRSVLAVVTVGLAALAGVSAPAAAQNDPRPFMSAQGPTLVWPPLPPATLLEGFTAPIGAVVTVGSERLGEVDGVSVDAREVRDSTGGRVRGVVIELTEERVTEKAERATAQQSYVDVDELPDLLRGIDRLLSVRDNPTQFRNFEMYYATKGELELRASSSRMRGTQFSVQVGRLVKARRDSLTAGELQQVRTLIEAASQKLATLGPDRE